MVRGGRIARQRRRQQSALAPQSSNLKSDGPQRLPLEPANTILEKKKGRGTTFLCLPWELRTAVYDNIFAKFYAMDQYFLGTERDTCEQQAKEIMNNILEAAPQLEEDVKYNFYSRSIFLIDLNWSTYNFIRQPYRNGLPTAFRIDDHLIQNLDLKVELPIGTGTSCRYLKILFEGYEESSWNPTYGDSTLRKIPPRLAAIKKFRLRITSQGKWLHDMAVEIVPPGLDKQVRPEIPNPYESTSDELCIGLRYPDEANIFGTEKELMKIFRSFLGIQDTVIIQVEYLAYDYSRTSFSYITPSWSAELCGDVVYDGVAADFWASVEDPMKWTLPKYQEDDSPNIEPESTSSGPSVFGYKARSILGSEVSVEYERLYFVHWVGSSGSDQLTWETESNMLLNASDLLERYKYGVLYNESNT